MRAKKLCEVTKIVFYYILIELFCAILKSKVISKTSNAIQPMRLGQNVKKLIILSCHFQSTHNQYHLKYIVKNLSTQRITCKCTKKQSAVIMLDFHPLLCIQEGYSLILCLVATMVRGMPSYGPWLRPIKRVLDNGS